MKVKRIYIKLINELSKLHLKGETKKTFQKKLSMLKGDYRLIVKGPDSMYSVHQGRKQNINTAPVKVISANSN